MAEIPFPVGVFVSDDNYKLIERLVDPDSTVRINDLNQHFPIEIFVGQSKYTNKKTRNSKSCFILTEPPEIFTYDQDFLDRFDFIAGPRFPYLSSRKNLIDNNPIIPFFVGVQLPVKSNYSLINKLQFLSNSKSNSIKIDLSISDILKIEMNKTKSISAIISSKRMTPQQNDRINFIEYLQKNSRIPIKIFGGLTSPIRDKFTILSNSTHHIAIENSSHKDYWTEKMADSLLSLNFTFYCGAPNLNEYFDDSIFQEISLSNFKTAQLAIEETFFNYSIDLDHLKSERLRLIRDHSLMGLIRRVLLLL